MECQPRTRGLAVVALAALAVGCGPAAASDSGGGAPATESMAASASNTTINSDLTELGAGSGILSATVTPVPDRFSNSVNPGADLWVTVKIARDAPAKDTVFRWESAMLVSSYASQHVSADGTSEVGGYTISAVDSSGQEVDAPGATVMTVIGVHLQQTQTQENQSAISDDVRSAAEGSALSLKSIRYLNAPALAPEITVATDNASSLVSSDPDISSIAGKNVYNWTGFLIEVDDANGNPAVITASAPNIGFGLSWTRPDLASTGGS